jgi:outer membrane protein, heavy metal efflux system
MFPYRPFGRALALGLALGALAWPLSVLAQAPALVRRVTASPTGTSRPSGLDSLVAMALADNPSIKAAAARADAARARVAPAGAHPDPMLMAGVQNFPISEPGFSDFMTMKMVGISQAIPFPGKLGLRTDAAAQEVQAAAARVDAAKLDVVRAVKESYYDIAYADRALQIIERNQEVLGSLATVAQARYTTGAGAQSDVLRVRTEMARLSDEAVRLSEARRTALARLDAALNRPSGTPVAPTAFPDAVVRAAVADSAEHVHFASAALGTRAADSPLLPLDSLQALAMSHSPMIQEHESEIRAQATRLELARKAHLPDFDVALEYGQRQGRSDMVSAVVSIPIPLQKGRKQDEEAAAARADLAALEAEHRAAVNSLSSDIAGRASDLERSRTQLALSTMSIIPQARATLASATASYQVGRVDFESVIDAQASLFTIETSYWQALTDFAKTLADLEYTVGWEVLR